MPSLPIPPADTELTLENLKLFSWFRPEWQYATTWKVPWLDRDRKSRSRWVVDQGLWPPKVILPLHNHRWLDMRGNDWEDEYETESDNESEIDADDLEYDYPSDNEN